jgi:antitoxin component of MazEF toxin-antitoxin module
MGYKVKLQKVSRPTNNTFFVTLPVVLVKTMELVKGEEFEWLLEDKKTLVIRRKKRVQKRKLKMQF